MGSSIWPTGVFLCNTNFAAMAMQLQEVQLLTNSLLKTLLGDDSEIKKLTSATPELRRDAFVVVIFAVVLFAFNWGVRLALVDPFVKRILKITGKMREKFAQCAMEVVFY